MASNHTLLVLGAAGRHREVRLLVDLMQRHALANEHTYGAAVSALDQAGRFDMALQYFEELYRWILQTLIPPSKKCAEHPQAAT